LFHGTIYSGTSHYLYNQQHRVSAEQEGSTPPSPELTIERIPQEFPQPSSPMLLAVTYAVKTTAFELGKLGRYSDDVL